MNKLAGFNVTKFSIELTPEADGTNMIGTVYIPNPTVMTIAMVFFPSPTLPTLSHLAPPFPIPTPTLPLRKAPPSQNPTPLTPPISQGNVTFNNYLSNTSTLIGTTTLSNLTLRPGNNTIPMRSTVNQTLVLTSILETYKDGFLPIDIVGNSSVYDGLHLTYLEKALASVTQHITLDVGSALKKVGLDPSSFGGSPP